MAGRIKTYKVPPWLLQSNTPFVHVYESVLRCYCIQAPTTDSTFSSIHSKDGDFCGCVACNKKRKLRSCQTEKSWILNGSLCALGGKKSGDLSR